MKSVITKLEVSERWIDTVKYDLEIHGAPVPNVIVEKRTDMENGFESVLIQVPIVDGKPVLAVSTMDAIARRVMPSARRYAGNHVTPKSQVVFRRYCIQ